MASNRKSTPVEPGLAQQGSEQHMGQGARQQADHVLDQPRDQGKREQTKLANKAAILEAARLVFAELGYEATTVRDIIRRTDLASGTFYNYFKSKEELFHALHDDGVRKFKPLLRAARDASGGSFELFLVRACRAYFDFLKEDHVFEAELAARPDWTRVRFDTPESLAIFDELKALLASYAQDQHLTGIDPELLTASAVGMAQEMGERILRGKITDLDRAAQFAADLILGGIARIQTGTRI
jgi:AcrR family transcriptional regulator